ncbi:MAG: hypothetical protein RBU25_10895 [Lentisphaeria bacterium]|jgi:hypothetical protein|nr:hypothetical protein [Lentisphaeria bacterium]
MKARNAAPEHLEAAAESAWRTVWQRFYDDRTALFYDFVSSYDEAHRFDHLPHPEEIARRVPNPNGWGTGMEDSTITGGVMLAAVCDRCAAGGDPEVLRPEAERIFEGLRRCGTASPASGMVLRSISPRDGSSHYPETSRDQLTHYAHGIWRFHHSPLSSEPQRAVMRDLLEALCQRLEQRIVPEHGFHFGMETGEPGLVDTLWQVPPHEVARLPMIYAIGWDLTGNERWRQLCCDYAPAALKLGESLRPETYEWCYPLFQHQISLEVLASLAEPDEAALWRKQMKQLALCISRYTCRMQDYRPVDVTAVDMDWRTRPCRPEYRNSPYGEVAEWPPAMLHHEFRPLRELGEALLIKLMGENLPLGDDDQDLLAQALTDVDYGKAFTCGMVYPQAAYWRHRANLAKSRTES